VIGDLLAGAGLLVVGAAAAVAVAAGSSRTRSAAMLVALLLAPVLVFGDQWDSRQIADLRDDPARLSALAGAATLIVGGLVALFRRRPLLLPLAVIAAIPFRIPLHSGGDQANLLIPLYLVIAAAVISVAMRDWRGEGESDGEESGRHAAVPATGPAGPERWIPRVLAAVALLYALQVLYSDDFSKGLQNVCFFIAPFSIAFALLADCRWDRRLLTGALAVVTAEALVFALVAYVEYATRDLLWNEAVIRSNQFHVYFRVNSLFWDPNVFGRYLAIVLVLLVAALTWSTRRRTAVALAVIALVLWLGLASTFSQSSFAALVAGLVVLCALRWSLRWTVLGCAAAALAVAVVAIGAGFDFSTENKVNKDTGGRANLISGGFDLFVDRPIWGYGSGSFSTAFRAHASRRPPVSESHAEPVTVAAEQGIIGFAAYLALLVAAFATLCSGLRETMPGLTRGPPGSAAVAAGGTDLGDRPRAPAGSAGGGGTKSVTGPAALATPAARAAILAAFVALLVHTMAYAGFFEDPLTWALLAIGASLAAAERSPRVTPAPPPGRSASGDPVRAPA
jgi:putative inorganic carbon (hco3(-)) transporter